MTPDPTAQAETQKLLRDVEEKIASFDSHPNDGDYAHELAVEAPALLAYIRALEKEHREMRAALEYTADKRFWRYNGHIAAYVWEGETRDGNELAGDIEPFEVCRRVLSSLSHHP